jgi:hypothetical protein
VKLILHIGTEKTGTTALQVFLKRHEKALFAKGVIFPDIFQTANAGELYLSGISRETSDYLDAHLFSRNVVFREKYIKQLGKELSRFATGRHAKECILSSELLYSRIPDVQALRRLKSNLFASFDDIHIVCYIRNQAELLLGLSMEALKQGSYLPQIRSPKDHVKLDCSCNYRDGLLRWLEVFPGRVTVRRYERNSLVSGDVIDDFLCVIGHPELASLSKPHQVNRSLTQDQVKILNHLNQKKLNREKNGSIIKSVLASLSDKADHGKLLPTKAISKYCEKKYQSSDEWVRATFFPDDHALWTESVDAADSQCLVLNQPMSSIVDILIVEQNKREVLLAQSLAKFLKPGQVLFLLKTNSLRWMARTYESLANAPSIALILRCKAFGSRLKYRLWSYQLSCGGSSIGYLPLMGKSKRV